MSIDERMLLDRDAAWAASVTARDVPAADAILDQGFALIVTMPVIAVFPRAVWLEMLPTYVVDAFDVVERKIDVDGDIAVITQRVAMQAVVSGVDRSGMFVLADVWRRRGDDWQVWRRNSTPLTAGGLSG